MLFKFFENINLFIFKNPPSPALILFFFLPFQSLLSGAIAPPPITIGIVDVRDVAAAHILCI